MKTKRQTFIIAAVAFAGVFIGQWPTAAATALSPASPATGSGSGPRIQFDSTVFDFVKAAAGQAIEHNFMFTNTGDQTLEIKDVRPTCGCTIAGAWDRSVEPGKAGAIPIRFNPAYLNSQVVKTVIVECNDPGQSEVTLQLKGTIWEPVEVNPLYVVFTANADCKTNLTHVVRIVNHLDAPLVLSGLECANPVFQASLKAVRPGREFELQITIEPPLKDGNTLASVSLKTSCTNLPVINITAYAIVQAAVMATPAQITLTPGPLPSSVEASVTIQNNDARLMTLSKPDVNAPGVTVRVREIDPGRRFVLAASFPAGFQIQRGQSIQVRLKTNNPQFPILTVPVFQSHHLVEQLGAQPEDAPAQEQQVGNKN